jgi:formyltetrahydrofolate hydrolase
MSSIQRLIFRRVGTCRNGSAFRSTSLGYSQLQHHAFSINSEKKPKRKQHARLLIHGPNASGIVASFSQLLYRHSCDIIDCASESSSDGDRLSADDHKMFFQRIEFDHSGLNKSCDEVEEEIAAMCHQFGMGCRLVSCMCRCFTIIISVSHSTHLI